MARPDDDDVDPPARAKRVRREDDDDRPRKRSDDRDDDEDRPRNKGGGSGVACPECGSKSKRSGPWPWYLGTVGALLCKAVICNDCGHEYDAKKPQANLATRKRNLAIGINGCGLVGIIAVFGLLIVWIMYTMKK